PPPPPSASSCAARCCACATARTRASCSCACIRKSGGRCRARSGRSSRSSNGHWGRRSCCAAIPSCTTSASTSSKSERAAMAPAPELPLEVSAAAAAGATPVAVVDSADGALTAHIAAAHLPAEPPAELQRITAGGAAERTLHWGRNYLYVATW